MKLKKWDFFSHSIEYLGNQIAPDKLAVLYKTVQTDHKFIEPRTHTQLRSLLGVFIVYRAFVPNFSRIFSPLQKILKKKEPVELGPFHEKQVKAFLVLTQDMTTSPILALSQKGLTLSLDTDAWNTHIGCASLQTHVDGVLHPVGYWSRSRNDAEKQYIVTKKECLAVVCAFQLLPLYL